MDVAGHGLGEPALASLGIVSAAPYHSRRNALRRTWMRYEECTSGAVLARFVVAQPSDAQDASTLDSEAANAGDLVILRTGVSGRDWSPLHTTFRWLQYASTTAPFRNAQYIGKMDDDVYLVIPEMVRHLQQMRASPQTSPDAWVYYGVMYWTSYFPDSFLHTGSGYDMLMANKASKSCIRANRDGIGAACVGSFPFTTGSMQLLSHSLALTLSSATATGAHINHSRALLEQPRKLPAFEDVWMGYALHSLLPSVRNVTLVNVDRFNYYDDGKARPTMKNTTILVHLAAVKDQARIQHAHMFATRHHCASNGVLSCSPFKTPRCLNGADGNPDSWCSKRAAAYRSKYGWSCLISPNRSVCPNGPHHPILPPKAEAKKSKDKDHRGKDADHRNVEARHRNPKNKHLWHPIGNRSAGEAEHSKRSGNVTRPAVKLTAELIALDSSMQQLVGTAAAQRHDGHVLVPLFANVGFLPFLKNLLCSMRRVHVHNWLVVSMDNATCPGLQRGGFVTAGDPHACVEPYSSRPLKVGKYGSEAFWRLVVQRPLWIRWLLTQGYTVLQCDVDVVFIRNPLPHLLSTVDQSPPKRCSHPASISNPTNRSGQIRWRWRTGYSCPHHNSSLMIQSEMSYGFNCGFYLARPHAASIKFMDAWMQEMIHPTAEHASHEQHAMLFTLGNIGSQTARRWLAQGMQLIKLLDANFPTGKVWYEMPKMTDKDRAYILHCNWVTQIAHKKLRLKRDNLWFLDDNDETCRAEFDPFAEACHRRCVPIRSCALGEPCKESSCHEFTQRALTDLARSVRRPGEPVEDRWHPMAFRRACAGSNSSSRHPLPEAAAALDEAATLMQRHASATAVFGIPRITDIQSRESFASVRKKLGLRWDGRVFAVPG